MDIDASPGFNAIYILLALGLFFSILVFVELGRRVALRRVARTGTETQPGAGAVEGAAMALLGLLLAFTFSGAASRFDVRRQQIVEEANDIGTAWLRLDLLPVDSQPALRGLFRDYLDARLGAYRKLPDLAAARLDLARSAALRTEIWNRARRAAAATGEPSTKLLLLPALNAMFDIATTRTMAAQMHQPPVIFELLGLMSLVCAFLAGYGMADAKGRNWIHTIGFATIVSVSVFVIFDLEHPRAGLIRLDAIDQVLVDLRASMR
jgi:hypothetical protein